MWTRWLVVAAFGVALGLASTLEVLARAGWSRVPSIGDLCGQVMRFRVGALPVGRIALLGLWWWLGWHFFAR